MSKIEESNLAWKAAQDDDVLRKAALERLVEGFHKIESHIHDLPTVINDAQQQIELATKEFAKKLMPSNWLSINSLPISINRWKTYGLLPVSQEQLSKKKPKKLT